MTALKSKNEQNGEVETELLIEESIDHEPVRGTRSLGEIYARCNVALIEPGSIEEAKASGEWLNAMKEELMMINKNNTWELVDKPSHKKAIGVEWIYKTKLSPNGTVNKYKARLVVKGYAQVSGVDYSEYLLQLLEWILSVTCCCCSEKMECLPVRCKISLPQW